MLHKISRIPHYSAPYIDKALTKGLAWMYSAPKARSRRFAYQPLYQANKLFRRISRRGNGYLYISRGLSLQTGQPLSVGFVGNWKLEQDNSLLFYEHLLFQEGTVERESLGPVAEKDYRRYGERMAREVDLVAAVGNSMAIWRPRSGDWMRGPSSFRMVFDFIPGERWEEAVQRMGQEYNLRVLKRSGLTYYVSRRDEDFQLFYHKMHVPLIKNRYKEYGEIVTEQDAYALFKEKGSVIIFQDPEGNPVGGGLQFRMGDVHFAYINGVMDGSQELIKKGALAAWYYFSAKYAFETGCTRFDSGMCQPFITDGVYIHKHRWGEEPSLDVWRPTYVLLWAPKSSPAALEWMKANPIHPDFVEYGGENITASYEALRQAEQEAEPKRKPHSKPLKQEAEQPDLRVEVFGTAPKEVRHDIEKGLYTHNVEVLGEDLGTYHRPLSIAVRNEENAIVAGLIGSFIWDFLHISTLWVSRDYRGNDLGTRLLRMAENAARLQGTRTITLETTSFQAIDFYRRFGYEIAGQIDNMPEGHTYYYLKKLLQPEDAREELPASQAKDTDKDPAPETKQTQMKQPVENETVP